MRGDSINTDKYIDLHLHLDGAITPEIAKKLATVQNIDLPTDDDLELARLLTVPADCANLNDFLKCFALPDSLMMTKEGMSEAVYLVSENIKGQGVIYAEIRFAPQLHTGMGMSQEDAVLAALEGLKRTEAKLGQIENAPFEKTTGNFEKIRIAVITAICTGIAVSVVTAVLKLTFGG